MHISTLMGRHQRKSPKAYGPTRNGDINFMLVVDDFRIIYIKKKDTDHLISSIQEKYEVTQDWTGGIYCGIKLRWD